jgi:hypothetical protein
MHLYNDFRKKEFQFLSSSFSGFLPMKSKSRRGHEIRFGIGDKIRLGKGEQKIREGWA